MTDRNAWGLHCPRRNVSRAAHSGFSLVSNWQFSIEAGAQMHFTGRHFTIRVSFSYFRGMLISHDFYCFFLLYHPLTTLPHHKNLPVNFLRNCSSLVQGLRSWEIPVTNWCTLYPGIWCKDCPVTTTGVKGRGDSFCSAPVCPRDVAAPRLRPSS